MNKIRVGIKMRVTPEQNRKVQEICFENGIDWSFGGKQIRHDTEPYLFVENTISFMYEVEEEDFLNDLNEEVSAELFIRTNGTCVESEIITEDNKGEQMKELKLECLVEGYEGTYFEVGQVWETRGGERFKVKGFNLNVDVYRITMVGVDDLTKDFYYYTLKGKKIHGLDSVLDLVRLISTEDTTEPIPSKEPQPKTLSEYLKENNAYENFVENTVEAFLKDLAWYKVFKSENRSIYIGNTFIWGDTEQGDGYWSNLKKEQPKNLIYDMNEIIFAEVDKRIAEQDSKPESESKTLSEYLKENNAYENFVENTVEAFLKDLAWYKVFKSENNIISLGNIFIFEDTKEGYNYWYNLSKEQPENLVYDMNEIVFAEVDKRIAGQKSTTKYMVFVEGKNTPRYIHDSYDSAETEAKRLSAKVIGCNVFVVEIIKEFKSKVIVEEV